MLDFKRNAIDRAEKYIEARGSRVIAELGYGYDGVVYTNDLDSVVKALFYEPLYARERDVYLRLQQLGVEAVEGCNVPRLIDFDDTLWIVEMEFVEPPFVLDFAGVTLDRKNEYPEEVYLEWLAEKKEQFGDHWPWVRRIISAMGRMGIHLADVKPGNITLE